jgi:HlyD family secretion protein
VTISTNYRRTALLPISGIALLVGALLVAGCGDGEARTGERPQRAIPSVEVVDARTGGLPLEQRVSGIVQARNQVTIYAEIASRVEAVLVENGDFVRQGQPLVRLHARQYEEQLRQAEADLRVQQASADQAHARLRELQADLQRVEQLAERQVTSALEVEQLRARVAAAQADYERALAVVERTESTVAERRDGLSRTVVRSPVAGVIGSRNAEVGMRADGSTPLMVVGDLTQMRVRVMLTERMLGFIREGQPVKILPDDSGTSAIEASISRISPFLDSGSFSTEATIDVNNANGRLRPGMFVGVGILYGESDQATLVPNSALFEDPRTGRMAVFIAPELRGQTFDAEAQSDDGPALSDPVRIEHREVDVVARGRAESGVRGIEEGDWVVVIGHDLVSAVYSGEVMARTRPMTWDRVISLQSLHQGDLLREFMDKQQAQAATSFAR